MHTPTIHETALDSNGRTIGTICGTCTKWKKDVAHGTLSAHFGSVHRCECEDAPTLPRIPFASVCEAAQ